MTADPAYPLQMLSHISPVPLLRYLFFFVVFVVGFIRGRLGA
jgi:hypothetical protein